jgi:hypothetical protein
MGRKKHPGCQGCCVPTKDIRTVASLQDQNVLRQLLEVRLKHHTKLPVCKGCYYVMELQRAKDYALDFKPVQVIYKCLYIITCNTLMYANMVRLSLCQLLHVSSSAFLCQMLNSLYFRVLLIGAVGELTAGAMTGSLRRQF